jgi:hypothetical protein
MSDTDSGLLLMFVKAWTPTISYSLNISGGQGGNRCYSLRFNLFRQTFSVSISLIIVMQAELDNMEHQVLLLVWLLL